MVAHLTVLLVLLQFHLIDGFIQGSAGSGGTLEDILKKGSDMAQFQFGYPFRRLQRIQVHLSLKRVSLTSSQFFEGNL